MSANEEQSDALDPLEAQLEAQLETELAALRPRTDALDRDRLMFLAGQVSVSRTAANGTRSVRFWRVVAGAMTAVAATLLSVIMFRPAPNSVQIVEAPSATPQVANNSRADRGSPQESNPLPSEGNLYATVFGGLALSSAVLDYRSSAYFLRAAALSGGLERDSTVGLSSPGNSLQGTSPVSHRQLLDSLLDEPASGGQPHRSSMSIRFQGVHS